MDYKSISRQILKELCFRGTNVNSYDSCDLVAVTNNFPMTNKIGHDVFDNVYKVIVSFEQA